MDAESVRLCQSRSFITAQMVNSLTSPVSGTVEPVFTQEHNGLLMQYPAQSAQIGQQITQIILTNPDPQTLLSRTARALGEIFQVDTCLIVAGVNPTAKTEIASWCADDYPAVVLDGQAQRLGHFTLTDDLASTEPLAIHDFQASDNDEALGCLWEMLSARAVLRIYTLFHSSVNGMIVLGRSQPHAWTTQEKELLIFVSQFVAIAISQLQLTQQVLAATRHRTLMDQLSLAIRSDRDLDEILQIATHQTAQALQVKRGLLLLLKYADPLFKSRPSKHFSQTNVTVACEWLEETIAQSEPATGRASSLLNQSFRLSESSLCQQAFKNAPESMVIANGQDSPTTLILSERLSIFDWEMLPAVLVVPLVGTHGKATEATTVFGFLVLQHAQPHQWHKDEVELVKWVSTQISATIIQNQTLRQVQSLVEDRTAQLQHSLAVQAKLYEKTRHQMDQLQQLNQLKEEFMSTMSHELRTPLTSMSLAIRMLRQANLPPERREKYMSILEEQCNKEIDLINDLLSLQQLEADQSQIQPQTIDLMLLIDKLAQSFEEKWADKRLTLRVESPARSRRVDEAQSLTISTDPDSLHRILLELLTNAGKYSDPDTTVCLQVTRQVQQSVNQVVLTLTNRGPGILPSDLKHIFDKFRRGQGVTQRAVQGTGLGLALVQCLVEQLNGTIDVKSCPLENSQAYLTSFTLTLPQFQQQH